MSKWSSSKASRVFKALLAIGWTVKSAKPGSHIQLVHPKYPQPYTWAFHDNVEIGPVMLSKISKKTGLTPEDL